MSQDAQLFVFGNSTDYAGNFDLVDGTLRLVDGGKGERHVTLDLLGELSSGSEDETQYAARKARQGEVLLEILQF